jgi:hypothetical protein
VDAVRVREYTVRVQRVFNNPGWDLTGVSGGASGHRLSITFRNQSLLPRSGTAYLELLIHAAALLLTVMKSVRDSAGAKLKHPVRSRWSSGKFYLHRRCRSNRLL